jgi:hypothetical protein
MGRFYRPMGFFCTQAKSLIKQGFEVNFCDYFVEYKIALACTRLEYKTHLHNGCFSRPMGFFVLKPNPL